MMYYKGDIVEILNGRDDIGSRHIVYYDQEIDEDFVCICHKKSFTSVSPIEIMIYKRPLKNWLRHIWKLIRN